MKRSGMTNTLRRMVRLRPLAVTFAMLLMHVASKETTIAGTIDRLIQFAMAYALVAWAMKPNAAGQGREAYPEPACSPGCQTC
jgi:hypothetical protein